MWAGLTRRGSGRRSFGVGLERGDSYVCRTLIAVLHPLLVHCNSSAFGYRHILLPRSVKRFPPTVPDESSRLLRGLISRFTMPQFMVGRWGTAARKELCFWSCQFILVFLRILLRGSPVEAQ